MTTNRKILIGAIAVVVVIAGGAFAWRTGTAPRSQSASSATATERPLELIPAELHTIEPRGLVDTIRFTGATQPIEQTIVKARVAGRLADVMVREGDRVKEGQVLAQFETRELQARVDERKSTVEAARADARWTARDRANKEALVDRNIVSRSSADQARAVAENKNSMVAVAEAQLEIAEKNLGDAVVRAPFDGVVGERIANQGESLPIDGKILTLLDTSHVEVAAQMPAADVVACAQGRSPPSPSRDLATRSSTAASPASAQRRCLVRAPSLSSSKFSTAMKACVAASSPRAEST